MGRQAFSVLNSSIKFSHYLSPYMVIVGVTSFKTTLLNLREMDKNIRATVLLNETKAFSIIEPLHCTF